MLNGCLHCRQEPKAKAITKTSTKPKPGKSAAGKRETWLKKRETCLFGSDLSNLRFCSLDRNVFSQKCCFAGDSGA